MFDTGLTQQQMRQQIQNKFIAMRNALTDVQEMHAWSSGITAADLTAIGFSGADAATILTACNDGNAVSVLTFTGLPPTGYPQPPSSYPYFATIAEVVGPQ